MQNLTMFPVGVGLVVGVITGWLLRGWFSQTERQKVALQMAGSQSVEQLAVERLERLGHTEHQLRECSEKLEAALVEKHSLRGVVDTARVRLQQQKTASAQQVDLLKQRNIELKEQIETISARVFADNSERMAERTDVHLQQLLTPLREQISEFRKRVDDVYTSEQQERHTLKAEIGQLKSLNERLSADAIQLSNALRGDNKTLGSWGELILERVLERAGLERGREFDREVTFQNSDGLKLRPDALLHLPGKKTIIIDSKASIKFYEKALVESTDETLRKRLMRDHVRAIRKHIEGLSAKRYESLEGINSLNFVLMFIPVEGALQAALEFDELLYKEAYDRDVVLVGPSSLMVTCRTIQNVWHAELRNSNASDIARKAGELVDKFSGFVEEIDHIGKSLDQAVECCDRARRKLVSGRGNMVSRAKKLQELGAHSGKMGGKTGGKLGAKTLGKTALYE